MMSAHRIGSEAWYEANPMAPSRGDAEQDRLEMEEYYRRYPERRVNIGDEYWKKQYTPEQLAEIEADIPF